MRNFVILLIILILSNCTKYVPTGDLNLMCSQLQPINIDNMIINIDLAEKIDLNNDAINGWCDYHD